MINAYAVLTPLLLVLIAGEFVYCLYRRNGYYNFQDSLANLATAIANQVVNVATGWAIFQGYSWLYARTPLRVPSTGWTWLALFLGIDFLFYWFHRAGHVINIMWAAHSPHHSSEELNYTVAARASVTQRAASFLFYAPLAALGWAPEVLLPAIVVHHVLQFWPHTRAIERMPGWFERWFNAPSHHRVHHGVNDIYLDKNYGGVLILWDKLFGTFEPETEQAIYGVRPPVGTWDGLDINFYYYKKLWGWAGEATRWQDKLLIWIKPPGWYPEGVERPGSWKPEDQVKYQTTVPRSALLFISLTMIPAIGAMMLVTEHDSPLDTRQKAALGALICVVAWAWTRMLERRTTSRIADVVGPHLLDNSLVLGRRG